jgi:sulfate adenylyltransferase subunit 1 (EFTu-like GTPase family)
MNFQFSYSLIILKSKRIKISEEKQFHLTFVFFPVKVLFRYHEKLRKYHGIGNRGEVVP